MDRDEHPSVEASVMESIEELKAELAKTKLERDRLREENDRLKGALLFKDNNESSYRDDSPIKSPSITMQSPVEEKIALFKNLFKGRNDVYPLHWKSRNGNSGYSPVCARLWDPILCEKPKRKCADCPNREFLPLTDQVIHAHLAGDEIIGIYPLLQDDSCWFLAVDFDKRTWKEDVLAFLNTCDGLNVPATLERSRSGQGGHIWIFFEEALQAESARKLGFALMTLTMKKQRGIGLDSYDRLFPNQDMLPKQGFGNLIALPLQKKARMKANSVFISRNLQPFEDQWIYLSTIRKMTRKDVQRIIQDATKKDNLIGVRSCGSDEVSVADPWTLPPSKNIPEEPIQGSLSATIRMVRSNLVFIQKAGLPNELQDRLIRLAAFQNPEFYKAQKMRRPVYGKPRIIGCAEDFEEYIALPRGSYDEAKFLLGKLGIKTIVEDERFVGPDIVVSFKGDLRGKQQEAAKKLACQDIGILSAAPAFGKTVVASWLIAKRGVNTLILVHRAQLADQWKKQLLTFLDISDSAIGGIGGGKKKLTGNVDVGLFQSLYHKGVVNDIIADYGHIIVDECHRVAAFSFEQVLKQAKARYVLGLTATLIRKDGHHPIIIMQCGAARFRATSKKAAESRPFDHVVLPRFCDFSITFDPESVQFHEIYSSLTADRQRNDIIIKDVIEACRKGKSPLLLTERIAHLEYLANELRGKIRNIIILKGGMSGKQRHEIAERLESVPDSEERVILSTGRYIGEGFDNSRLDTLFLCLPISWKGTLQQYAGRLHRLHENKKQVIIYDYVDRKVPMLMRMFKKRQKGYRAMGYSISDKEQYGEG